MPNKPVIEIGVNDDAFAKFKSLFDEYTTALGEQPKAWEAINDASASAGEALKSGALSGRDALSEAATEAGKITQRLREAGKVTASHTKGFTDLGRVGSGAWKAIGGAADASIAKTSSGLMDMAKSIAPMAGEAVAAALGPIGIAVAAAGAAIAGLKALADIAVPRQRTAFGLGTTTGQLNSFEVYGNQFMGQDALRSAANAQSNFGNAGALGALGIDFNKARGMSKSDLAFEMLRSGVRIANASPNLPLGNNPLLAQYAALTGDKDFDQLRNAMAMGPDALSAAQKNVNANAGRMGFNKNSVNAGAALSQSLNAAGITAQSALVNNLSGQDTNIAKAVNFVSGGPNKSRDNIVHAFQRVGSTIEHGAVPALNALKTAAQGAAKSFTSPIAGTAAAAVIAAANKAGVDPLLALADAGHESGMNPKARVRDFYSDGSFAGYSTGLFMLNDNGEGHGMAIKDMMDASKNANVAMPHFAAVAKAHPNWSPGQIAFAAEGAAAGPGGAWKKSYIDDVNARYSRLVNQQRNSRPPTILVEVSNPTQSRVSVSVKGANP